MKRAPAFHGILAVAAALFLGGGSIAHAVPGNCDSSNTFTIAGPSFNQNFLIDGPTSVTPLGGSGVFTCIQQQDKLFSAFNFASLPGSATANLNFASIGGDDTHTIALIGSGLTNGQTYTLGYNIQVTNPNAHLISSASGILQTAGQASLAETLLDNDGDTFNINFTQGNGNIIVGNASTPLDPIVDWIDVTDVLTLSLNPGSDASGVSNSFVEALAVPEPAALLLLGIGVTVLGLARRRAKPLPD